MSESSGQDHSAGENEYEVERILAETVLKSETYYLVKWKGYGSEQCTWEPADNFLTPETLLVWTDQKARGDVLDQEQVTQVQESMDSCNARQEEVLRKSKRRKLSTGSDDTTLRKANNENDSMSTHSSPTLTSRPSKHMTVSAASPSRKLPPKSSTTQTFHGIQVTSKNKSQHMAPIVKKVLTATEKDRALFRTLSHQNKIDKIRRQEPIPIHAGPGLKPPSEWADRDSEPAHILPPAPAPASNDDSLLFFPETVIEEQQASTALDKQQSLQDQSGTSTVQHIDLKTQDEPLRSTNEHTSSCPQPQAPSLTAATFADKTETQKAPTLTELMERREVDSKTMMPVPRKENLPPKAQLPIARPQETTSNPPRPNNTTMQARLVFREHEVGIMDLDFGTIGWLRKKFGSLGSKRSIPELHFQEELVLSADEFDRMSRDWQYPRVGIVSVMAHPATGPALRELGDYLERHRLGAIWQFPNTYESLTFTLYCDAVRDWRQLSQGLIAPRNTRLRILVQNIVGRGAVVPDLVREYGLSLRYLQSEGQRPMQREHASSPSFERKRCLSNPHITTDVSGMDVDRSGGELYVDENRRKLLEPQTPTLDPRLKRTAKEELSQEHANVEAPVHGPGAMEFEFSTDFGALLRAVRSHNTEDVRIVVALGRSQKAETKAIKSWALTYTNHRLIFDINEAGDWKSFVSLIGTKHPGMVFLDSNHNTFTKLHKFGQLAMLSNLGFFELSFQSPLGRQLQYTINQVFRGGTVFMISEHSMVQHPAECSEVFQWFQDRMKTTGTWRIMVRPRITDWLLDQARGCAESKKKYYAQMATSVFSLMDQEIPATPIASPMSDLLPHRLDRLLGNEHEKEEAGMILMPNLSVFSDVTQENISEAVIKERSKAMVSHFCGWAAINATHHRRFMAIDDYASKFKDGMFETIPAAHVVFCDAQKFVADNCKRNRSISES